MIAINRIKKEIEAACQDCGRDPKSARLVIASKYFTVDQIKACYDAGAREFGENRVQDFLEKKEHLPKDIRWHFFGHLQKNKVGKVSGQFDLIHSVDSLELAEKIDRAAPRKQAVLLQVKTSEEGTKTGFSVQKLREDFSKICALENLSIRGLMTVAPRGAKAKDAFKTLRELKEELGQSDWELSMGMSEDYPLALKEGATILRIGRALIS